MEFSTNKITPNDNVKIPSMNGNNSGYMETDELKEYMNDGLITQSITDGDTTHSPSGDAVNGALNAISGSIGDNIIAVSKEFTITLTSEVKWHRFNVATYASLEKSGYTIIGILDMNSNYIDNAIYVWNISNGYGLYVSVYWLAQVALSCPARCYVLYKKNT